MIRFICNCESKVDEAAPLDEALFNTFDGVVLDDEGYMVCVIHHARRYGWRSVPYMAGRVLPGAKPGWSPLQYERWLYWHEIPMPQYVQGPLPVIVDRRDNRDPQEVGLAIMGLK